MQRTGLIHPRGLNPTCTHTSSDVKQHLLSCIANKQYISYPMLMSTFPPFSRILSSQESYAFVSISISCAVVQLAFNDEKVLITIKLLLDTKGFNFKELE